MANYRHSIALSTTTDDMRAFAQVAFSTELVGNPVENSYTCCTSIIHVLVLCF